MNQLSARLAPGAALDEVHLPLEARYREEGRGVRFDECGPNGTMRAAAILRHAQDLAWRHSELLAYGRAWYEARGVGWVVRSIDLLIDEPPHANEELIGTTALVGFRHVMARRHTRLFTTTGRVVADATIDWVMTDREGRPTRFPAEIETLVAHVNATFVPTKIAAVSGVSLTDTKIEIPIRRADIDPLGHVNHAAWLEIAEEGMAQVAPSHLNASLRQIRLEYLAITSSSIALLQLQSPEREGSQSSDRYCLDVRDATGTPLLRGEFRTLLA